MIGKHQKIKREGEGGKGEKRACKINVHSRSPGERYHKTPSCFGIIAKLIDFQWEGIIPITQGV